MKIRIHRGTEQIGGTCIEVESSGSRIVLDVGLPLDAPDDDHESLLGAVISHPHQDHFGLVKHVGSGVPVYIGEAAHNILTAASRYVPGGQAFSNPPFLSQKKPVEIGPVKVTPYLLDHSAFDAYSLLVEADDKRVF